MYGVIAKPKTLQREICFDDNLYTGSCWMYYPHQSKYKDIIKTRNNSVFKVIPFAADKKCVLYEARKQTSSD